jgi:hypothetical protein
MRLERVEGATCLVVSACAPQSKSGRESSSESELRTTCSPLETTLLLAPEFAEVCEAAGGCASGLVALAEAGACGVVELLCLAGTGVLIVRGAVFRGVKVKGAPNGDGRVMAASKRSEECQLALAWETLRIRKRVPCGCGVPLGLSCGLRWIGEKKSLMLLLCGFIVAGRGGRDDGGVDGDAWRVL